MNEKELKDRTNWILDFGDGAVFRKVVRASSQFGGVHGRDEKGFKERTKVLALEIIRLANKFLRTAAADLIGRQLIRSGTSIGANYRAACRGRFAADLIARPGVVEEEADETLYWSEIASESASTLPADIAAAMRETHETLAMRAASIKTLRARQ